MAQTKVGNVVFEHNQDFTAEVDIRRGDQQIKIPFAALRAIVAESVRQDLTSQIERMPTDKLLKKLA